MAEERERETWGEWVDRMKAPGSPAREMTDRGIPLDSALIILQLGKLHCEIVEFIDSDEGEEWRRGKSE